MHLRLLPLPEQHEQHARDLQELEVMLLPPPALVRLLVLTMSLVLLTPRASHSPRALCTHEVPTVRRTNKNMHVVYTRSRDPHHDNSI